MPGWGAQGSALGWCPEGAWGQGAWGQGAGAEGFTGWGEAGGTEAGAPGPWQAPLSIHFKNHKTT